MDLGRISKTHSVPKICKCTIFVELYKLCRVELKYFILRWNFIFLEKLFHFLNNSLLSSGEDITRNSFPTDEAANLQVCSATCPWEVSLSTCWYWTAYLRCAQGLKPNISQTFVIWHLTFHSLNYFSILIFYVIF